MDNNVIIMQHQEFFFEVLGTENDVCMYKWVDIQRYGRVCI